MGDNDYYGYVPGSAERVRQAGWIQRHMGDDITHYPDIGEGSYEQTPKPPETYSGGAEETRDIMRNSIEMIRKRILGQSYEMVQDAANGWRDIADYLTNLSLQIRGQSDALRAGGGSEDPGWTSPGAEAFMARGPGATMMSIDDWAEAAQVNYDGLSSLATHIAIHHGKMKDLWDDYLAGIVRAAKWFFYDKVQNSSYAYDMDGLPARVDDQNDINVEAWQNAIDRSDPPIFLDWQAEYVDALKEEEVRWTLQAQQLEYEMGQKYWQVMGHELNGGSSTVFEGPEDAVVPAGPPGTDIRRTLAAMDAAANLAKHLPKPPAIDTDKLSKASTDAQQLQAKLDKLTGDTPAVDKDLLKLQEQAESLPNVTDLDVPATATAAPPVPPPVLPPNLGDISGAPAIGRSPRVTGSPFPGSGNLADGRLPKGVLGGPKLPNASAPGGAPPPPGLKGGKVLGKQKGPQEALPQRPGAPGTPPPSIARPGRSGRNAEQRLQEPTAGRPGGSPPGTTSPVLGGRQRAGGRTAPEVPAVQRPGQTRAGTAPSVLGGKSARGGKPPAVPESAAPPQVPGRDRGRSASRDQAGEHVDAPMEIGQLFRAPDEMGTTTPTLRRRGPLPPEPRDVGEVPRSLRANRPVIDSPAELAARRRAAQAVQEANARERLEDDYQQIRAFMGGEEAWTVQTPGGPVIGGAERPAAPQAEPRPALGST
jgi:hypothetical protein